MGKHNNKNQNKRNQNWKKSKQDKEKQAQNPKVVQHTLHSARTIGEFWLTPATDGVYPMNFIERRTHFVFDFI